MNDEIKNVEIEEEPIIDEEDLLELPTEELHIEDSTEEEDAVPKTVMVGVKEYNLYKTGAAQARQVSNLLNWLGKYGAKLADTLSSTTINEDGQEQVEVNISNTWEFLGNIGELATEDALIDLFVVATGCSLKEAEEYFNILTLVDAVQGLLSQDVYLKVFNRFF